MGALCQVEVTRDDANGDRAQWTGVFSADHSLSLTVRASLYAEHGAVLLAPTLTNTGNAPSEPVHHLRFLDLVLNLSALGEPVVHTLGGGVTHGFFPPAAYRRERTQFIASSGLSFPLRIDSGGTGRSSDRHLPFFWVEDQAGTGGMWVGVEWSSLWHVDLRRQKGRFAIVGEMEGVETVLRPGESLELPRVAVGFYVGDHEQGINSLRHFVRDWFPKYRGAEVDPPVTWNHAFTFQATITDEIFRRQVPVCADLGFEWMQIDWGWFAGCNPPFGTFDGIGNWRRVDPVRFPDGIAPLADLVRAHGMKFCTWVDPEEAHPSSDLAREHPEWMLYVPQLEMGLVDFGRPEVQEWFLRVLQEIIDDWGVHKLKWDHNIDPQPYWSAHESPRQRGLMQMRHVRGVWRVWEELTARNPQLLLENCSSGGRRFDLGTFGRAHIHHGSDFNFQDDIVRNQISGVNTVMPTNRVIGTCTWGAPDFPDVFPQSRFGGILRFSQDFASWPAESLARIKTHIEVYKQIREFLDDDFYPLLDQPRSLQDWDGWQFHDPGTGAGFCQVFRMRGEDDRRTGRLRALDAGRDYEITDPYTGVSTVCPGRELTERGLDWQLAPDSSAVRRYRPMR